MEKARRLRRSSKPDTSPQSQDDGQVTSAPPTSQLSLKHTLPLGEARTKLTQQLEPRVKHGGIPSIGRRKTTRPFTPNTPIHIVLKSKRARGEWSMMHRKHRAKVLSMIYVYAARFKVHVYRASNVGDHIHLLVKAHEKKQVSDYLRVLAGRVAVTVSGARKHIKRIGKFWDYLCWSRLVNWGRDFYNVRAYVVANELEEWSEEHRDTLRRATQAMAKKFGIELDENPAGSGYA